MSSAIAHAFLRGAEGFQPQQLQQVGILSEDFAGELVELSAHAEKPFGMRQLDRLGDYRAIDGIDSARNVSPERDFFSVSSETLMMASVQALEMYSAMEKSTDFRPS